MNLNLLYVHSESIGYGRLGINLARELVKQGVNVFDHLPEPGGTDRQRDLEHLAHLNTGDKTGICPVVCWVSVPTHARGWYKGQVPVIFTMWESMSLPPSFRETLHEFEAVAVPSWQNVELFSQYHGNVHYVSLGVDPEVWHYVPRKPPGQFFNFLIAGSGPRKGTDLAHQAFRKVFSSPKTWGDGPVPLLTFKNPRGEAFHGERIQVVAGRLDAEQEVAIYEDAHCYLQPSRGEGFGLQPLQAMAQGCPTILTNAHGHESFAYLGYGISATPSQSAYFIYGDAGQWWEPSLAELCERMEWVYNNYDKAVADAKVVAQDIIPQHWTWATTAEQLIHNVIGVDLLESECRDFTWHAPTLQKFRIITNQDWSCEVAGSHFQFLKGEPQWQVADVKRILFEANLLDPACLEIVGPHGEHDLDLGLLPEQLARLPEYNDRHSFCALCGQKLNSQPTRSDLIYGDVSQ